MTKHVLVLLLIATKSLFSAVPPLWIVGKTYVALHQKGATKYWNGVAPASFSFNNDRCELWAIEEEKSALLKFSMDSEEVSITGKADVILSNADSEFFFTRTGDLIEKRAKDGSVTKTYPVVGALEWLEIQSTGKAGVVALSKKDKDVTLHFLDLHLKPLNQVAVTTGIDLWNVERLRYDIQSQMAWVGYTATTPSHMYAPILKAYSPKGDLKYEKVYSHRGVFWDFYLTHDHSLLFSYDVPSNSGFTVPLNSYLDSFTLSGMSPKVYGAETNYFIDSLSASAKVLYMIQRPIFGSDKSRVVAYAFGTPTLSEETLVVLPEPAKRIYHCAQ